MQDIRTEEGFETIGETDRKFGNTLWKISIELEPEPVYPLPNDTIDLARLEKMQVAVRSTFGKNILAPIDRQLNGASASILDLGTGPGSWAIEVASERPNSKVIGMDLSPVKLFNVPHNCEFIVGDFTKDLVRMKAEPFNLVHARFIFLGVLKNQWRSLFKMIYRLLKPGVGWIQYVENVSPFGWEDQELHKDSFYAKYRHMIDQYYESRTTVPVGPKLEGYLRDAGFVDIKVVTKIMDLGDWRGNPETAVGSRAAKIAFGDPIPFLIEHRLQEFIPNDYERRDFAKNVFTEYNNSPFRLYLTMKTVIARRPF